jgi:hypothetical protein
MVTLVCSGDTLWVTLVVIGCLGSQAGCMLYVHTLLLPVCWQR